MAEKSDDLVEVTGEALGVKASVKGHSLKVFDACVVASLVFTAASSAVVALKLVEHEQNTLKHQAQIQTIVNNMTGKLEKSFNDLTEALHMQSCLNTLPLEQRRQEFMNANSPCAFISKQR